MVVRMFAGTYAVPEAGAPMGTRMVGSRWPCRGWRVCPRWVERCGGASGKGDWGLRNAKSAMRNIRQVWGLTGGDGVLGIGA
jgi:hypothetical protein